MSEFGSSLFVQFLLAYKIGSVQEMLDKEKEHPKSIACRPKTNRRFGDKLSPIIQGSKFRDFSKPENFRP